MTVDLDTVRRKRLAEALSEAHKRVQDCEETIRDYEAGISEVRRDLVEALAYLADAQRRYDQSG